MNCQYKLSKYTEKLKKSSNHHYKLKYQYYKRMVGSFNALDQKYIRALDNFISRHNDSNPDKFIDPTHGLAHMLTVLCHADKALEVYIQDNPDKPIDEKDLLKVKLAALLHDIDDSKYFGETEGYPNARAILSETAISDLEPSDIDDIIEMIDWVSSSKNGDRIPEKVLATGKEYLLYPRYADRLEAIGIIGLDRTLNYTIKLKKKGDPRGILFDESTERANNKSELFDRIATEERYRSYNTGSRSMMDHFYDKLLRIGTFPIANRYFEKECATRQQPLIDIALEFGRNKDITEEQLKKLMEDYIQEATHISTKCLCETEVDEYIRTNRFTSL